MKYYIWNVPRKHPIGVKEQYLYRKKYWWSPKEAWLNNFNTWYNQGWLQPHRKNMIPISEEEAFLFIMDNT